MSQGDWKTKMLADCYKMAGSDPDNNDDERLALHALDAVSFLRKDYADACDEVAKKDVEIARLTALLAALEVNND